MPLIQPVGTAATLGYGCGTTGGLSSPGMTSRPARVLADLVASGQESGGAVAVVRDGVLEVDARAGRSDSVSPWQHDTLAMTFSVAKPFAALAFRDAVAEGHIGLDQPVVSVWPEYGRAGKERTTMRHLLAHQAGVPVFPQEAVNVEFDDRDALTDLLASASPIHPPGAGVAEHALTYGHLLDEVLRRAAGVPLAERFARIARAAGWDLHLCVEGRDVARAATLVDPDGAWQASRRTHPLWGPALGRPHGLLDPDVLNSDRFRRTPFPAVSMYATARDLAYFYDDVIRPDGHIAACLGDALWRAYTSPAASGHDVVLDRAVTWTLGFQVAEAGGRPARGMGGAGGGSAWGEPAAGYGAAFLTRRLGNPDRGERVWEAIVSEL